jgi:hypothetical protein
MGMRARQAARSDDGDDDNGAGGGQEWKLVWVCEARKNGVSIRSVEPVGSMF